MFTIRKKVLWESETASDSEVNRKEVELIKLYRSNDPRLGYNKRPKFGGLKQEDVDKGIVR